MGDRIARRRVLEALAMSTVLNLVAVNMTFHHRAIGIRSDMLVQR